MATPKQLREVAEDAARRLREAQARRDQPGAAEHQVELDAANSALHAATGTSVDVAGTVVSGFADQLRVEGRVSVPQGIAESRFRLREAGIDTEELDDAAVRLRERHLDEAEREQAVNDLIDKHARQIIGAPKPEDLTPEEKRDQVGELGHRELVGATLEKDPTTLTPADFARFDRLSGHDAVIDAVLGTDITPLERADARSRLRNQEFDARRAATQPGSNPDPGTPPPDPGADDGSPPGVGDGDAAGAPGTLADPGGNDVTGGSDGPEGAPPDGGPAADPGGDDVTGGSDGPGEPPPDGGEPSGDPLDGEVTGGSDDPEGPPPDGEPDDSNSGGGSGGGSAPPADDDTEDADDGGFDYYGPTNPSGESGEFHRDDDGTWTDENGEVVTDPDTVASLEHEYEEYEAVADDPPPEDDDPPPEDDEEEPPEDDTSAEIDGDPDEPDGSTLPEDLRLDVGRIGRRDPRGGATDPSDDAGFEVRDPSVQLPTHAELGQSLFGQPSLDVDTGGGGATFNPGADSQGGGVTDPSEEDDLAFASGPEDDPFADARGPLEPTADRGEDADGAAAVGLVPSDIAGPVDDGPDLPDLDDLS